MALKSPFATLYLAVLERLKSVDGLKHIDMQLGQLTDGDGRPRLLFPAALIDFENWTFSELGAYGQAAEGEVAVYIAFARVTGTSNLRPETVRVDGLEYWELEQRIHEALHGWEPNEWCSSMTRRTATPMNNPMSIRLRRLGYRVRIEDWSAMSQASMIEKPPVEFLSINTPITPPEP